MGGIDIRQLKPAVANQHAAGSPVEHTRSEPWWQKDISFSTGLPDKIKADFYLQLHTLLDAGVDIRSGFKLVTEQQKKAKFRKIFDIIQQDIISGKAMSAAMRDQHCFSDYEIFSTGIGEETGRLSFVFKELHQFFQKKIKQRRQIVSALTYPMIVVVVAILAIGFMANFIVPMFADVFKRFGNKELPAVTQFVVLVSESIKKTFGIWLLVIGGLMLGAVKSRKKLWYRRGMSRLLLRIPMVGELVAKIYIARMCNSMSLLISSKVPVLQAIQLVIKMVGFYPIEVSLRKVEESILLGKSLHTGMSEHAIFPPKLIAMIKVGEEVNKLGDFFERINIQYTEEVMHETALLSNFIEPLIIVFLGLAVGIILIAMYLPLFTMGQSF